MYHHITVPLRVAQSKHKDFILNMNNYRNTHYQSLNKAKIKYYEYLANQVKLLPRMQKVAVTYTVYPASRRKFDLMNVVSVHSKFFLDALSGYDKLFDDTFDIVIKESTGYGEVDPANPRVEILIEDLSWL